MEWVVLGFVSAAVIFDLRTFRIPNALIVLFLMAGLVYNCCIAGPSGVVKALLCMCIMVIALLLPWRLKALGAGDIKLFSVISLFFGLKNTFRIIITALFIGGVIGFIYIISYIFSYISGLINKNRLPTFRLHRIRYCIPIFIAVILFIFGGTYFE